jgi:hypothetical protein
MLGSPLTSRERFEGNEPAPAALGCPDHRLGRRSCGTHFVQIDLGEALALIECDVFFGAPEQRSSRASYIKVARVHFVLATRAGHGSPRSMPLTSSCVPWPF